MSPHNDFNSLKYRIFVVLFSCFRPAHISISHIVVLKLSLQYPVYHNLFAVLYDIIILRGSPTHVEPDAFACVCEHTIGGWACGIRELDMLSLNTYGRVVRLAAAGLSGDAQCVQSQIRADR